MPSAALRRSSKHAVSHRASVWHAKVRTVDLHSLGVAKEASDEPCRKGKHFSLDARAVEGDGPGHELQYSKSAIRRGRHLVRPTPPLTGRSSAKRGGYPTAQLLGAPVERQAMRSSTGFVTHYPPTIVGEGHRRGWWTRFADSASRSEPAGSLQANGRFAQAP